MVSSAKHNEFVTTSKGLDRTLPPMKLFEKAKIYGIWNPSDIDFSQDIKDWQRLTGDEKDVILRLTALFAAGEEAVTLDLLPLMMVVAREGRIEEEMFLTTFLWEEAKHTDYFQRFLNDVLEVQGANLTQYHTDNYRFVFYEALPNALDKLTTDSSPEAQLRASVTYNMIVEGVLAETGYHAYFKMLKSNNLMPGNTEAINKLKQDESRHIAYGIYLISRLVAQYPHLYEVAEETMNALFMPAMGVINEIFSLYDPVPFGLRVEDFTDYALMQFQKRMGRITAARGATLQEVISTAHRAIDEDDA